MTIRTILATSAVATLLALGANAQTATDPAAPAAPAPMPMAPAVEPATPAAPLDPMAPTASGYTTVDMATLSADQLIGANVIDGADETIASVDDVLIANGAVDGIVAKFGGFLGFGSNTVLLTMNEVEAVRDANGTLALRSSLTPEAIEARPEFVKDGVTN